LTKARQQTGAAGEQIACNFLQEQGYRIIERNHRSVLGELDIIAAYWEFLVFCEVKTRKGSIGPHPSLSVSAKIIEKLRQLGELYLSQKQASNVPATAF
jgi:putative endonuclease